MTLIEKIKNIFERKGRLKTAEYKKDTLQSNAMYGASYIAQSVQKLEKFQAQKKSWQNVFHF
ncbi:MAG: hypothetical protein HYW78_00980 [Parcubacteria group bacterium]|nr:hypothetical protein [Parcubacteria group bacterium]